METSAAPRMRFFFPLTVLLLAAQCGGDADEAPATETGTGQSAVPSAAVDVPQACGFIPRAELEEIVG